MGQFTVDGITRDDVPGVRWQTGVLLQLDGAGRQALSRYAESVRVWREAKMQKDEVALVLAWCDMVRSYLELPPDLRHWRWRD